MEKKVIILKQSVPFMTDTQLTISGTSIQFVPVVGGNAIELSELATKQLQSQLNTLLPDKEVERLRGEVERLKERVNSLLDKIDEAEKRKHKELRRRTERDLKNL